MDRRLGGVGDGVGGIRDVDVDCDCDVDVRPGQEQGQGLLEQQGPELQK